MHLREGRRPKFLENIRKIAFRHYTPAWLRHVVDTCTHNVLHCSSPYGDIHAGVFVANPVTLRKSPRRWRTSRLWTKKPSVS